MLTEKNIHIPIYDFKVEICVFSDIKEAKEKYPEYIEDEISACTLEYRGCSKCKLIIPCNDYPSVVHELEHVKNLVWKTKGYTPQNNNDEPDAYLIGWLFGQVDKVIKKHLAS